MNSLIWYGMLLVSVVLDLAASALLRKLLDGSENWKQVALSLLMAVPVFFLSLIAYAYIMWKGSTFTGPALLWPVGIALGAALIGILGFNDAQNLSTMRITVGVIGALLVFYAFGQL